MARIFMWVYLIGIILVGTSLGVCLLIGAFRHLYQDWKDRNQAGGE